MARERGLARRRPSETTLESWDTFREMERMFRDFWRPFGLMRRPWRWMAEYEPEFMPDVNLKETDNEFILSATVPGMSKDDIDIDVTRDTITVSGERKMEEEKPGERYHLREQSYGSFNVCYSLPSDVKSDQVKASYKNGVLEVVMPKAEAKPAKKVKVEAEAEA